MSWGERSCKKGQSVNGCSFATMERCNVDCEYYEYDGHSNPDSGSMKQFLSKENVDLPKKEEKQYYNPEGYLRNRAERRAGKRLS